MEFYCIHLPEQADRLERLTQHLEETGVEVELNIIDGISEERGSLGCAKSHQKIVNYARRSKMEQITVIEDDIRFSPGFENTYLRAYADLPNDWDIFVGGVSWVGGVKTRISNNLVKLEDFSATHFMVYRRKSYKWVLSWNIHKREQHIDRYLGKLSKDGILNIYCATPFLATQFNGYSKIRNSYTDDDGHFNTAQQRINEV